MGAALVLDSPGQQYKIKHYNNGPYCADFVYGYLKQAEEAFEKRCGSRCLETADKAVKLDPENVDWWRLRAWLAFHESLYSSAIAHDDPRGIEILEECARRDPDNALYDYLAANYYFKIGARLDDIKLVVEDAKMYQKGMECFERGQAKPHCTVGDAGFTATADFLALSGLPIVDQPDVVNSRKMSDWRIIFFRDLWRLQVARSEDKASAGEVEAALAPLRENLRLCDQFAAKELSAGHDSMLILIKDTTTNIMMEFVEKHKDALDAAEVARIVKLNESAKIEKMVVERAAALLPANKKTRVSTGGVSMTAVSAGELLSGFLVCFMPPFIVLLSFLGLLSSIFIRSCAKTEVPTVGPIGQIASFLAAAIFSFCLFGLAPAEIIEKNAQSWIFTIGLLSIPIVVVFGIGWIWLKLRSFQYSIRALLIGTLIFYLAFANIYFWTSLLTEFPFPFRIPARGWGGLDLALLDSMKYAYGDWCWAILQWNAYGGGYVTLAIWIMLIAIVYTCKIRRRNCRPDAVPLTRRKELAGVFYSLGRPAFLLAMLFLICYLVLAPGFLEQTEQAFQEKIAFARHPERHWAEVEKNIAKVRADEATMKLIENSAKEQPPVEENTGSEGNSETPSDEANADR
jgi:tetratricopeptide (TPR) repeat protein